MDGVAAANSGGEFMLHRPRLERGQQRINIRNQQIRRLGHLYGEAGIQHIG